VGTPLSSANKSDLHDIADFNQSDDDLFSDSSLYSDMST
jgi:hypothetical protein